MHAMQCLAPGKVSFIETPKPELKPGHALVKTMLVSLCGSDVHMVYYEPAERYPFPPGTSGHEMIGVVEAVTRRAAASRRRYRATLAPYHQAMAEYYLAPVEHVLVLPKAAARPTPDGATTRHREHACQRLPNLIGERVAVIGLGSAGLFFAAMCRRLGAEQVIALDIIPHRVAVATHFGATHAINNVVVDPLQAVAEITNGKLADVVTRRRAGGDDQSGPGPGEDQRAHPFFGIPRAYGFAFDYESFFPQVCHHHLDCRRGV